MIWHHLVLNLVAIFYFSHPEPTLTRFNVQSREVSNWRVEMANNIEPLPTSCKTYSPAASCSKCIPGNLKASSAAVHRISSFKVFGDEPIWQTISGWCGLWRNLQLVETPRSLPRCLKINNYWCIKSAKWNGEIATDKDGHVAFSTAEDGAFVAALLLRHYYVDLKRHSAIDIISRWAPDACSGSTTNDSSRDQLARHGLGNTVRARYLAKVRGRTLRPSHIRDTLITQSTTQLIRTDLQSAKLNGSGALVQFLMGLEQEGDGVKSAGHLCARTQLYAKAAAKGLAADEHADLLLFDEKGKPTDHLPVILLNMAMVEIGPYRPVPQLADKAFHRLLDLATVQNTKP